jgi:hypothetical protein
MLALPLAGATFASEALLVIAEGKVNKEDEIR